MITATCSSTARNTYTYNVANRLTTVDDDGLNLSYAYTDVMGDRLQQTENDETTNYHLDIALGLTQVLDDGELTYLYGVNRVAQANPDNDFTYFHGDTQVTQSWLCILRIYKMTNCTNLGVNNQKAAVYHANGYGLV